MSRYLAIYEGSQRKTRKKTIRFGYRELVGLANDTPRPLLVNLSNFIYKHVDYANSPCVHRKSVNNSL